MWEITSRGEYLTPYTPYQAEASQGTLQLIYEYQTMMTQLMAMEVTNASLYDGASALGEAVLMALRLNQNGAKRVIVPRGLHPAYRQVLKTITMAQEVFLEEIDYARGEGGVAQDQLASLDTRGIAAVIIPQPNFFGVLEEVDAINGFCSPSWRLGDCCG